MEDDNEDIGAIKEAIVGRIEPGKSASKSIYLHGGNITGSRLISITVSVSINKTNDSVIENYILGKIYNNW